MTITRDGLRSFYLVKYTMALSTIILVTMWWAGILLAIAYSLICLPRQPKGKTLIATTVPNYMHNGSIIIAIDKDEAFHVHHYILLLPCLIAPLPSWLRAFVATLIIQGLCYSDRCDCFISNPYDQMSPTIDDWV